jgi:hypothetical protein
VNCIVCSVGVFENLSFRFKGSRLSTIKFFFSHQTKFKTTKQPTNQQQQQQ